MWRLWLLCAVMICLVRVPETLAGESLSFTMLKNPGCPVTCPIDSVKKSSIKITPTNKAGMNGLSVKFQMSGALKNGAAATATANLIVPISVNNGSCVEIASADFSLTNGSAKMLLGGSSFTPPLVELPGSTLSVCNSGPYVRASTGEILEISSITLGDDPD